MLKAVYEKTDWWNYKYNGGRMKKVFSRAYGYFEYIFTNIRKLILVIGNNIILCYLSEILWFNIFKVIIVFQIASFGKAK